MGRAKATNAEVEMRILRVYKMLARGYSRYEIHEYCRKEWGVKRGGVDIYMARARKRMKEDLECERDEFAAEIIASYRDLRRMAQEDKQHAVALGCISRIAAITNVDGSLNGRPRNLPQQ